MRLDQLQDTRILGAERDPFLHALLGLRVLCERFDALLSCRAAEEEGVQAPREPTDEIPELALLGALRLRRLLAAYEASLCATASEPPRVAVTAPVVERGQRLPTALLR